MKKNYVQPATMVVSVEIESQVLQASRVSTVSGNASLNYGGGNNGAARVKEVNYDVWGDDWSN